MAEASGPAPAAPPLLSPAVNRHRTLTGGEDAPHAEATAEARAGCQDVAGAAGHSFTGKSSGCLPAPRFTELNTLVLELLAITYTAEKEILKLSFVRA